MRRPRPFQDSTASTTFVFSLLDVLSNAVGAAVLLFLVVGAAPRRKASAAAARSGFVSLVTFEDQGALVNIILEHKTESGETTLFEVDGFGESTPTVIPPKRFRGIRVLGVKDKLFSDGSKRFVEVAAAGPELGTWSVSIRYADRDEVAWRDLSVSIEDLRVDTRVLTQATVSAPEATRVRFGERKVLARFRCDVERCVPIK